jgi:MATE family multidrug resistance protein
VPGRELFALAWPIAAAMLGETILGLVDTKLTGGLGPNALGGVGVATTLMFLSYSLVFGLMRGVKVRTAHAVGAGRSEDGVRYAQAGMFLGAIIGLLVFWIGRDISWALVGLGIDPVLVEPGRQFMSAITWGAPATCVLSALIQHRQGLGDTRSVMIVGLAGNVLNAVLAWSLIYGHLGLPALGVRGGGFATSVVEAIELGVLVVLLVRARPEVQSTNGTVRSVPEYSDVHEHCAVNVGVLTGTPTERRRDLSVAAAVREVAELGLPAGLQYSAEMLAFTALTAILGSIGGAQIAAHQIALATIRVSFLPGVAVGEAASILVGRALGGRNLREADQATFSALRLAIAFMAFCGFVFAVFAPAIARSFTTDPLVALVATRLLWVAAIFQVLDAMNIVLRGALRGAKDVRIPAVIGIGIVWTCIPTAALVLGKVYGWGSLGGWCGFIAETSLSAALFWRRWRHGSWRFAYVRGAPEPEAPQAAAAEAA